MDIYCIRTSDQIEVLLTPERGATAYQCRPTVEYTDFNLTIPFLIVGLEVLQVVLLVGVLFTFIRGRRIS